LHEVANALAEANKKLDQADSLSAELGLPQTFADNLSQLE
jgi:hypothetical protein